MQIGTQTLWSQTRTYDSVGNVLGLSTVVPTQGGGSMTENESFCYDALNRLVWAGNSGTPSGGDHCMAPPTGTTLPAYTQSYTYDSLDRILQGPAGQYSGHSVQAHSLTNVSSVPNQYAAYDAMGNMTCRNTDPTTAHTCAGSTPTGALMSYDAHGQLANWTAPSGTVGSTHYLYDSEGNRVLSNATSASSTTDTVYFDGYTETVLSGGTTTTTKYYNANGARVAVRVGSASLSYLVSDPLGSNSLALNSGGQVSAVQHYSPYGTVDYTWGSMPTSFNYAGERLDSQTGLLYDNFRYYDPFTGNFVRSDNVQNNSNGMDPYTYVGDNPETATDPTGQYAAPGGPADGGSLWFDDAGNQTSPPKTNIPVWNRSSTDPATYGAEAVAEDLAKEVKTARLAAYARKEKAAVQNQDWAAGEWYITGPDGTRIDGGSLGIAFSIPGDGGAHAERQLLEQFLASLGPKAVAELLDAYADDQFATMLHVVVFTQYPPCPRCAANVLPAFMADMAQMMNDEMIHRMVTSPDILDGGGDPMADAENAFSAMTLDVYGSTYVPDGPDWNHVFTPGTTDTYGVTDYWHDEVTYTPTSYGFGYGE